MLPASRVPPPSRRAPNWGSEEARTWEHYHPQPTIPPPRLNRQAESRRQPVRVSPALHPAERPSHTHTPKPGFGGRGHEHTWPCRACRAISSPLTTGAILVTVTVVLLVLPLRGRDIFTHTGHKWLAVCSYWSTTSSIAVTDLFRKLRQQQQQLTGWMLYYIGINIDIKVDF